MKAKVETIFKFLKRLTVFDWLVIFVVFSGLVFIVLFIFKEEKWVKAEVKIAPAEWWWSNEDPPLWLSDRVKVGDSQYDTLGRKVAEVLDVKSWGAVDIGSLAKVKKPTYLTLNLKVEIDSRTKKFKFNNQPLEVGRQIDLELGGVGAPGLVTNIEGVTDTRVWQERVVQVRLLEFTDVFPETLGVQPWEADAIKIGDEMRDTQGRKVAEVLDKKVTPADKIVVTSNGRIFVQKDPIKKDVTLVLKLKTFKQEGVNYFLDGFAVKVGSSFFLSLPEIDVWPEVTKIIE